MILTFLWFFVYRNVKTPWFRTGPKVLNRILLKTDPGHCFCWRPVTSVVPRYLHSIQRCQDNESILTSLRWWKWSHCNRLCTLCWPICSSRVEWGEILHYTGQPEPCRLHPLPIVLLFKLESLHCSVHASSSSPTSRDPSVIWSDWARTPVYSGISSLAERWGGQWGSGASTRSSPATYPQLVIHKWKGW